MAHPTEAEYLYWRDILIGKYASPARKPEWLSRSTVTRAVQKPALVQTASPQPITIKDTATAWREAELLLRTVVTFFPLGQLVLALAQARASAARR